MTEGKERSALFKFLYVFFRIITFPIFAVLYVLKHPLLIGFLLLVGAGFLVYYPINQGVEMANIPTWYKNKYSEVKLNVAHTVVEKGYGNMISDETLKDLADDVEEQQGKKSENYNAKVSRDEVFKEKTANLKKRGGFKRQGGDVAVEEKEVNEDTVAVKSENPEGEETVSGGLATILGNKVEAKAEEIAEEAVEVIEENVALVHENETPATEEAVSEAISNPEPTNEPVKQENNNTDLDEFELF